MVRHKSATFPPLFVQSVRHNRPELALFEHISAARRYRSGACRAIQLSSQTASSCQCLQRTEESRVIVLQFLTIINRNTTHYNTAERPRRAVMYRWMDGWSCRCRMKGRKTSPNRDRDRRSHCFHQSICKLLVRQFVDQSIIASANCL